MRKRVRRDRCFPDLATYIRQTGDTQARIAATCGLSQASLSRIVSGERIPRPAIAERLANYARVPLDSFTRVYLKRHARATAAARREPDKVATP